jgi:hypothetical protein
LKRFPISKIPTSNSAFFYFPISLFFILFLFSCFPFYIQHWKFNIHYSFPVFSATLNRALRARGFLFISASVGTIGFFVIALRGGVVVCRPNGSTSTSSSSKCPLRKKFFTILSSSE